MLTYDFYILSKDHLGLKAKVYVTEILFDVKFFTKL